jgi:uncharacterized protein
MRSELPRQAAWRFVGAVDGFEVVHFGREPGGGRWRGQTTALEDGRTYAVRWELELDERWHTRSVRVTNDTVDGSRAVVLTSDGAGEWTVDGRPAPHLAGLVDVDLEASACTNALPVRRLSLPVGVLVEAPAVYVHALDLAVTRLDQTYRRSDEESFDYISRHGTFRAVLRYDSDGLVHDYPGIARRVGC